MKSKKYIFTYSIALLIFIIQLFPFSVHAVSAPPLCPYLLTFKSWFCGVTTYATNENGIEIIKDSHKVVEIKQVVHAQTDKETGKKHVIDSKTKNRRELKPNEIDLTTFIWIIIINSLYNLFSLTGYLAVGFLIYGGYLYVLSNGELGNIEKAKKTLKNAIIGLIIASCASLITAFISNIILV